MVAPIVLLGRTLNVKVLDGAEGVVDEVFPVIQGAADVLNGQFGRGHLSVIAIDYIRSLRGLGIALHRSFTPCAGTADQADGLYVYFLGDEDVKQNPDPLWWASTMIHDGGHAWLSQKDKVSTGVGVEEALTQVQIDYYTSVGGRPTYIDNLQKYKADAAAIQNRIKQEV